MCRRYSSMEKERMSVAIDQHGPFGHVVEAADQVDQRRLARAAGAYQSDHFSGANDQVDAFDHRAIAVAKADVAELDVSLQAAGMDRDGRFGNRGVPVEDAEDPLRSGRRPLHRRNNAAHRLQASVEPADVHEKCGEDARR